VLAEKAFGRVDELVQAISRVGDPVEVSIRIEPERGRLSEGRSCGRFCRPCDTDFVRCDGSELPGVLAGRKT